MKTGLYEDHRKILERQANRLRAELGNTLDALEHRRHDLTDMFDVKLQIHKHVGTLALAGAGALMVLTGAITYSVIRSWDKKHHPYRERWLAIKRIWDNPEKLAR